MERVKYYAIMWQPKNRNSMQNTHCQRGVQVIGAGVSALVGSARAPWRCGYNDT